jgi:hypothetical protein
MGEFSGLRRPLATSVLTAAYVVTMSFTSGFATQFEYAVLVMCAGYPPRCGNIPPAGNDQPGPPMLSGVDKLFFRRNFSLVFLIFFLFLVFVEFFLTTTHSLLLTFIATIAPGMF